MDAYQTGYRNGYNAARCFYSPSGVRDRLDWIVDATRQLQADIAATGGRPPARLLAYFDEVLNNATVNENLRAPANDTPATDAR